MISGHRNEQNKYYAFKLVCNVGDNTEFPLNLQYLPMWESEYIIRNWK